MTSNYNAASTGVTGYDDPTGTHGPHSSRIANAVDPRVDSDADHRRAPGGTTTTDAASTGYGAPGTHTTDTHTAGTGMANTSTGTGRENTGERAVKGVKGALAQGHVCLRLFSSFYPLCPDTRS